MIFDWIAAALELSGVWKLGNKKKIGFLLSAACNVTWMIVAMITTPKLYGLLALVIVLFFLNIYNFIKWKKDESKTSSSGK